MEIDKIIYVNGNIKINIFIKTY